MKKLSTSQFIAICLLIGFVGAGCNAIRNTLYSPKLGTNTVPAHIVIQPETNLVATVAPTQVTRYVTNTVVWTNGSTVHVITTNYSTVYATNVVPVITQVPVFVPATQQVQTNSWVVNPGVEAVTAVGSLFGPQGMMVGTIASGILNLGLLWVNKKQKKDNGIQEDTAVTIMQSIDGIRIALRQNPQGRKLDEEVIKPMLESGKLGAGADIIANIERLINDRTPTTKNMDKAFASIEAVLPTTMSPAAAPFPSFSPTLGTVLTATPVRTLADLRMIWSGYIPKPTDLTPAELELFAQWTAANGSVRPG